MPTKDQKDQCPYRPFKANYRHLNLKRQQLLPPVPVIVGENGLLKQISKVQSKRAGKYGVGSIQVGSPASISASKRPATGPSVKPW